MKGCLPRSEFFVGLLAFGANGCPPPPALPAPWKVRHPFTLFLCAEANKTRFFFPDAHSFFFARWRASGPPASFTWWKWDAARAEPLSSSPRASVSCRAAAMFRWPTVETTRSPAN